MAKYKGSGEGSVCVLEEKEPETVMFTDEEKENSVGTACHLSNSPPPSPLLFCSRFPTTYSTTQASFESGSVGQSLFGQ